MNIFFSKTKIQIVGKYLPSSTPSISVFGVDSIMRKCTLIVSNTIKYATCFSVVLSTYIFGKFLHISKVGMVVVKFIPQIAMRKIRYIQYHRDILIATSLAIIYVTHS